MPLPPALASGPATGGVIDLPAVVVILLLMLALLAGVKQSARLNRFIVMAKLGALGVFLAVAATTWVILQSRRRRIVALQRSAVSDQVVYELSRIADALDRLASRPMDQTITATASSFKEDEPRTMPFSMFGRER